MFRSALRALRHLFLLVFALSFTGANCGQTALAIMPGVFNDPGNLTLRRALLSFGTGTMCSEMLRRSVPLRMHEDHPSMGRFFPVSCFAQQTAAGTILVQFSGTGYAWTNATKKLTFEAGGTVEYETDFLMEGSTLYVYFRSKATSQATFNMKVVEAPASSSMLGLPINVNAQSLVAQFGPQLVRAELSRGFTVIRKNDGSASFGVGVVEKGKQPFQPFKPNDNGRTLLANDRSEVHQGQRDFAGPFEVTGDGRALYLTVSIDGASGADVMLVPVSSGQAWRDSYIQQAAAVAPPVPARIDEPVVQGVIWRRTVALPKGAYYLVLDNTPSAGRTSLPVNPNDDRAATFSYAVEEAGAP
ncbi:MAG: hypothetical protein IPK82_11620 [Polyangiaceae bacterium]|nr:hypothetical protein [Polyangiaceae bacterium]